MVHPDGTAAVIANAAEVTQGKAPPRISPKTARNISFVSHRERHAG